ncbi:lytic transglycosylase domain-containing protein [Bosea lathyri]|uniref:Soluble lytic murein transglycosylase n=1 Tax=Bosea lathyri TaxID=1036778 RepID=A0A1H6CF71_9HYPH|nr:lytic transglycosylase domain-containing protein [Bosea lathyri]SEG71522.1 soluble lytic murein transglycosylase [Bosea lathyri]
MALPIAGKRLVYLAVPAFLVATSIRASNDGDHPLQQPRPAIASPAVDVQTTAALPPFSTDQILPAEHIRPGETADPDVIKTAVAAYKRGALVDGDAIASAIRDRTARALLEWVAIRSANNIGFSRLDAFLRNYPNYPATQLFRRRAEEALIAEKKSPEMIRAFFYGQRPVSPAGRVAFALALKADGKAEDAAALIRQSWRQDHLGEPLEKIVLAAFGDVLTQADHRLRTERYLFREKAAPALRNAARVSADYVVLAKARLASATAKQPIAPSLIAAVPASLKTDISFSFLLAQQARRANKPADAAKALVNVPRDPTLLGDGDEWWVERRLIARKLLDDGDAAKAYEVAAGHGAESPAERIDAEWHAGFIALRFRNDAETALKHFTEALRQAETPISVSRAGYWQGRAFEALGKADDAKTAYERAAQHPIAYYGQLARARLGLPDLPLRRTASAALDTLPGHRGALLLYKIGERTLAATMLGDLAQRLHTTPALEAVAGIAQREGDTRALLAVGKAALQRGFPLDMAAFPTSGVPEFPVLGDPMERAIVHAIARQESAFDPTAESHAGARGLMQMMPATARETARRANLPFDLPRLGYDALYSAQMGAAHLNDLLKDWRGSYILTFAAYNAGSGNVKKWIAAYGDPRRPEIDAVDWVERIPFYETRNYVQRVMENLQVYRQRLDQRTAYLIDQDLKRGGRLDGPAWPLMSLARETGAPE